jgi:hypothetical protein
MQCRGAAVEIAEARARERVREALDNAQDQRVDIGATAVLELDDVRTILAALDEATEARDMLRAFNSEATERAERAERDADHNARIHGVQLERANKAEAEVERLRSAIEEHRDDCPRPAALAALDAGKEGSGRDTALVEWNG